MNPLSATFNRSQKPSVCFNCPDRAAGCHASCKRYQAEVAERAASSDQKRKRDNILMENYKLEKKRRR